MLSTEELLTKAVLSVTDGSAGAPIGGGDFGGAGEAALSIEQVTQFIELMSAAQVMLADVRTVTSSASKWTESIIQFAERVMRPGVEATRLGESDRTKPSTGIVEISTVLVRGEVPVSDEVMEDNVAGQNITGSIQRTYTDRAGFDIEDLFVNGTASAPGSDAYLNLLDGWLYQCVNGRVGDSSPAQVPNYVDGSTFGKDYQAIFKKMLQSMPKRFLRGLLAEGRFYVPVTLVQGWKDILISRGTNLGDMYLTTDQEVKYQGYTILGAPSFDAGITTDDTCTVLLSNKNNLYAGYHRAMKFETWRDPREGATSYILSARVDAKVAVINATVASDGVDVSLD